MTAADPRAQTRSAIIAALNHNEYAGQIILDSSGGVWDGRRCRMLLSAQQLENLVDQMLVLTRCDDCPLTGYSTKWSGPICQMCNGTGRYAASLGEPIPDTPFTDGNRTILTDVPCPACNGHGREPN